MSGNFWRSGSGRRSWVKLAIALLIAIVIFELYVQNIVVISGNSMNNTIFDGDRLITRSLPITLPRGTLVVFKTATENYVKRCVAIPGDTFEIRDGKAYVNQHLVHEAVTALVNPDERTSDNDMNLPIFEQYDRFWNNKNFGPLIIPYKGMRLLVDSANFALYKKSCSFENLSVGKPYVFTHNYYFVLGDNWGGSTDSRNGLGLICLEQMIAIPVRVLYSVHSINRTLKSIQ